MTTTGSMDSKSEYMSLQNPAGKIYLYNSDISGHTQQDTEEITVSIKDVQNLFYTNF